MRLSSKQQAIAATLDNDPLSVKEISKKLLGDKDSKIQQRSIRRSLETLRENGIVTRQAVDGVNLYSLTGNVTASPALALENEILNTMIMIDSFMIGPLDRSISQLPIDPRTLNESWLDGRYDTEKVRAALKRLVKRGLVIELHRAHAGTGRKPNDEILIHYVKYDLPGRENRINSDYSSGEREAIDVQPLSVKIE